MRGRSWELGVGILGALLLSAPGLAAQNGKTKVADRPLATREELQAAVDRDRGSDVAARINIRLTQGDFKRGDRIALLVQGEPALTDTFTISGSSELILPPPTTGALSLKGVLRSELEPKVTEYIAKFRNNPVVRAQPLLRLSVQGEVAKGGIYDVPADGQLADALMAAGGTTQYARTNQVTIERNGQTIWHGTAFDTDLDALNLQDGDQLKVGGDRPRGQDMLRTTALLVSIIGGLYGLSRAIK